MPRHRILVRRLQKPLILALFWAFSISLCLSQTAGRVDNVQPGNVLALVSGVLQAHYHGLQKVESGTNDLISNYDEFRAHLLPYRAHFRFHLDGNSLFVTMEDLESPGNGTWTRSLIPANAAEAKLIAQMVDQLDAANQQLAKSTTPPRPVPVPDPPAPSPLPLPTPGPVVQAPVAPVVSLDKAKHLVFDPTPSRCAEGLCAVSKGGLWGFIDYHGNPVLDFRYPSIPGYIPQFSHGVCAVGSPDSKDPNSVGVIFIDKKGNTLFGKKAFQSAGPFTGDATAVRLFEMVNGISVRAILDLQGHLFRYTNAFGVDPLEGFHDGLITASLPQKEKAGGNPFIVLSTERPIGFLNTKGEWAIPAAYVKAQAFNAGIAWVAAQPPGTALKWGAINTKGKVTIPFNFSKEPEPFSEGLAIVHCTDNTSGYVDASGKPVIPCQYTLASRFVHGQAYVRDGNSRNLLVDKTGKILVVSGPDTSIGGLREDGLYAFTRHGDGAGLLDGDWSPLVPPLFESVGLFPADQDPDGLAWAVYREKGGNSYQGFIDRQGNFVLLQEQSKF